MVLKVSEANGSFDRYHGDFEGSEGLLRASCPSFGETFVGGMALRSKRSALCAEPPTSSCGPSLSVASVIPTSPSKSSVLSASSGCSMPIPIVLPKKHNSFPGRGSVHTWIDGMRAQSPPPIRSLPGDTPELFDLEAAIYKSWLEDHPSALSSFDRVIKQSHNKQIVVFLDYDGTLSPIVEDPERAFMSAEMRATVKEVASCFPTAVISGRSRPKVYDFVRLSELYYAGSHGMDIQGPSNISDGFRVKGTKSRDKKGNDATNFQPASEFLPLINKVTTALIENTKMVKGAKVENNKFCVSVHFRRVKEELWEGLAERVGNVMKEFPTLSLTHGRKVLEVRPSIEWDKGKAVEFLLKSLGFQDTNDLIPLYLGDDKTDEDAFKVVNSTKYGCSILVSSVAKPTEAKFSLRDPSEVMGFLCKLVHWEKCRQDPNSIYMDRNFSQIP
ncbi:probable trehalose-phosphate phosphatase H [Physcomitrium patens]|uniref:Trehalose 6-phosphate phosphatase n=1 Tax=Physcomitrium patens TaxID=3218 RepID=A0A2K1K061_PHYPA|nr:probable trehalose-phosphate phosphatase H [Physcomitrium patens]XP_024386383.1 probable trehalose-phosphate phosphatase H [Physcomitrium patens]XP_024386384.1 probable trehalose-phosphate phosphatase H [Physcomitrium patens]XP_024386385.1 probable trehalose-phosphate phosphatase H [Physcomitrium patens]XP_024386387.1 probable trehalose-phosphate phosphatase H [Physcomitrium patens]XP_024386388.1 probable trehalose-phosphate phosphatase H [Physcomitrium patens]PNR47162.1 hypothetical prote|eukprot:XP_024386382.1 probable trehalose-phosphate phosphatase H [Physcomitrella patens]